MTEKRFNLWDIEGTAFIEDHKEGSYHIGKTEDVDIDSLRNITKRLNIYTKENEQLKQSYTELKHKHSLLHDVCIEAECDRDSYQKDVSSLEKENEQLKEFIKQNCPMCRANLELFYKEWRESE